MSIPPVDPINPQQTDAAAGSVFTGERTGNTRGMPRLPRPSLLDLLLLVAVPVVVVVVLALIGVF